MASTTALFTGLSGLISNSRRLDVIGNNISNVNTTAFKSNRMQFTPTFSRNFTLGTAPGTNTGGTNPGQIGLGVTVAGTQRNFNNGAIGATGVATDVAIEGDGFFIVDVAGTRHFTRAGNFVRNPQNELVTQSGARVMGFGVDEQFNVIEGDLVALSVPVGTLTLAEASRNVIFNGNLNASGSVGTTGSVHTGRAWYTDAAMTIPITSATDLTTTDIYMSDGATMADFTAFLEDVLGLDSSSVGASSNLGGNVTINAGGQLVITGNEGTVQDLALETADFVVGTPGSGSGQPLVLQKSGSANGESVRTSFVVYDSLGTPLTIDLTFTLQETSASGGTTWQFVAESNDNDAVSRLIGLGEVTFDATGRFTNATNQSFSITRTNGAVSPLTVNMDFNSGADAVSSLTDSASNLAAVFQDGSPIGTLSNFSIGEDGRISGSFTNGLTRTIGQVALAKFSNPEGLVDAGDNLFRTGPNSGTPLVAKPRDFGTGRLVGGALELSNVDLSQEFINMILASTGYSAASRVITTTDELINQLLVLGR